MKEHSAADLIFVSGFPQYIKFREHTLCHCFKSVIEALWVDKCQFFHRLTFWTIKSFLLPFFLFVEGLPCRRGILDIIIIVSFLLCDTLWINCRFYLHHPTGFIAMLYGQQVRGLDGICEPVLYAFIPIDIWVTWGGSGKPYVAGRASANRLTVTS